MSHADSNQIVATVGWRRRAQWFAGVVWFLAWFELYLEIYRHHHVAPLFHFGVAESSLAIGPGAQPGGWLQAVLVCSAVTPVVFIGLNLWNRLSGSSDPTVAASASDRRFPFARSAMGFGVMLTALGSINQLIQHSPIEIDLTLRHGSGGFVVIGLLFIAVGFLLSRKSAGERHRPTVPLAGDDNE